MAKAKTPSKEGIVILFEGIDGVGKTTQLKLAQDELVKQGWPVHATRNLGGTPIGERLREVTLSPTERSAETDLYISVAIQTALVESVEAERSRGKVILIDRGPLSLAAYHIYGNGATEKLGWRYADEGMRRFKPDLVLLYQTDLDVALARAKRRSSKADYFASKPKNYFERVMRGFQDADERYPAHLIDASSSISTVHLETMRAINALLANHKR